MTLNVAAPCIRFCEPAYAQTPLIAEWHNTLSSLSYVGVGLLCVSRRERCLVRKCMGWNVVAVGVGSALFHATQRFDTELMDELPMLSLMVLWLYYNVCNHPRTKQGVLALCLPNTIAGVVFATRKYIDTRDYHWFIVPFTLLLVLNICVDAHSRWVRRHGLVIWGKALAMLLLAHSAWQTERRLAQHHITSPHCLWLHSFWHVCSACAVHLWLQPLPPTAGIVG